MPEELAVDDFLTRPPGVPMIDVRTPDEFAAGHIPGAVNVPLFTNEERVEIGTAYKRQGRSVAVRIGLRHAGPRLERLAETLLDLTDPDQRTLHIHCWRGGMRSASVAWLMESTFGCRTATLKGGYKSFRRWALDSFSIPREVHVVSGLTGSGKTEVLRQMATSGAYCLDLEKLARHKGSAFGMLGEVAQPGQAQFENDLALAWRATDSGCPVWLEDESRMIGKRVLPEALWIQKLQGRFHVIELPEEERISHLCEGYARFSHDELVVAVEAIRSRLGGDRTKAAIESIRNDDAAAACRIVLSYYDRTYRQCLAQHPPENVTRHPFPKLDPRAIAASLIQSIRQTS